MHTSLSPEVLETQLNQLSSYQHWNQARQAEDAAFAAVPNNADLNSSDYLKKQLRGVTAREVSDAARSDLLLEIGEQDDSFAPLHYRLGALSAFDNLRVFEGDLSHRVTLRELDTEDRLYVSSDPVKRAAQIGDELNAITTILDDDTGPTPVTMVQNDYCTACRVNDTRVVSGEIEEPDRALEISSPEVVETDGVRCIVFNVPTVLHGVGKVVRYRGHHPWYPPEVSSFSAEKAQDGIIHPPIPRLKQLTNAGGSRGRIDALFLGEKALQRSRHLPALDGPTTLSSPGRSRMRRRRTAPRL